MIFFILYILAMVILTATVSHIFLPIMIGLWIIGDVVNSL